MINDAPVPQVIDHDDNLPVLAEDTSGPTDKDVDDDYERVRENLGEITEQGAEALDEALEVAKESEHPRAYEVVGQLIKNLTESNLAILDVHRKVKEIKEKVKIQPAETINQNLVISTSDLQKMLEGKT